jgi:hypothetical protein
MPHLDSSALDTDPNGMAFLRDALAEDGLTVTASCQKALGVTGLSDELGQPGTAPLSRSIIVQAEPPLSIAS